MPRGSDKQTPNDDNPEPSCFPGAGTGSFTDADSAADPLKDNDNVIVPVHDSNAHIIGYHDCNFVCT